MNFKSLVAGLAIAAAFSGSAMAACTLEGDAAAGKAAASACKSCHVFEADKPSRPTGPNLHSAYGRKAGTLADYTKWSDAMKAATAKGVTWDEKSLDAYVADPKAFLNSATGQDLKHGMFFNLKDEAKRKQIVAYMKAISGKADCN